MLEKIAKTKQYKGLRPPWIKSLVLFFNQRDAHRNSLSNDVPNSPPSSIWTRFVPKTYFEKKNI